MVLFLDKFDKIVHFRHADWKENSISCLEYKDYERDILKYNFNIFVYVKKTVLKQFVLGNNSIQFWREKTTSEEICLKLKCISATTFEIYFCKPLSARAELRRSLHKQLDRRPTTQ